MKNSPGIGYVFSRGTRLFFIILMLGAGLFLTAGPLIAQPYALHVSSCKNPDNASEEVAGFRALGLDAFSRYENVPGKGMWHRVYIGRYNSPQQASAAADKLKSQGVITYASVQPVDPLMRRAQKTVSPAYTPPPPSPKPAPEKAYVAKFEPQVVSPRAQTGPQAVSPARTRTGPSGQYDALLRQEAAEPSPKTTPPPPAARTSTRIVSEPLAPPTATAQGPATQPPPNTLEPAPQTPGAQQQPPNTLEPVPQQQPQAPPPRQRTQRRPRQEYEPKPDSGFSIGARAGVTVWPDCDDLVIESNGERHQISRNTTPVHFAVVPGYRFNDVVTLEGSIEKPHAPNIDAWYFTLGPKVNFPINENFSPYVRTGLVYGLFDWDKVPGSFKDSWGWEFGTGLDYYMGRFSFGFDALYRDIKFKYSPPSGQVVLKNHSKQDLSGYSFSGTFGYHF